MAGFWIGIFKGAFWLHEIGGSMQKRMKKRERAKGAREVDRDLLHTFITILRRSERPPFTTNTTSMQVFIKLMQLLGRKSGVSCFLIRIKR
jgi:hypothetical protein